MKIKQKIYTCIKENVEKNRIARMAEYKEWKKWSNDPNKRIIVFGASTASLENPHLVLKLYICLIYISP